MHQNRFNVWEMYCSVRFASTLTQQKCFGESVTSAGTRYDWRLIKSDTTRDQGERWKTGELCAMCWHSLDPDVPLESRVAFLYSLCCRPFFPKLPHLRNFVISFVWGVCIEVRIRWRSSARTLGVRRTECHTHISHLIPVLASRVSQLTSSIMSSATRSHFHSVCTCVFRWGVSM